MKQVQIFLVVMVFLLNVLVFVNPAAAQSRDYRGSYSSRSVNVSSLDDDAVERFSVPVLFRVTAASLRSDFGEPRGDGTRSHEGQDMLAPKGTPIVSPTAAVVTATGDGESSGKYVYTAAPGGETFRYMHLDSIASIKRGDKLKVGDLIGTVGDTGNAPDGVYHLHFEVRDDKNKATDPFPRLGADFTLKQKISFLDGILDESKDDDYAEFLVKNFTKEIAEGARLGYDLPSEIEAELKKTGLGAAIDIQAALAKIILTIPSVLTTDIKTGDSGAKVSLLQLYIMYNSTGPARDKLALSGATGYFGPVTAAALSEYQTANKLTATGIYDAATRKVMQD
jgi:peptidoglycan LD-endopeptidase LytH